MSAELIREALPWWRDLHELAAFCRWMEDEGRAPLDRWELVELADRYTPEHEEFLRWDALERDADAERYAP